MDIVCQVESVIGDRTYVRELVCLNNRGSTRGVVVGKRAQRFSTTSLVCGIGLSTPFLQRALRRQIKGENMTYNFRCC